MKGLGTCFLILENKILFPTFENVCLEITGGEKKRKFNHRDCGVIFFQIGQFELAQIFAQYPYRFPSTFTLKCLAIFLHDVLFVYGPIGLFFLGADDLPLRGS